MWSGKYRRYLYGSTVNPYRNDYFKLTSSPLVFMSSWAYIVLHLSFFRYGFSLSLLVSMSTLGTLIFFDFDALHGIHRSPFLVYPLLVLLDPCSMWQMWYNKWHIVSALIFSAFHVVLEHSSLSFYRLSVIDSGESFFRGSLSFILF